MKTIRHFSQQQHSLISAGRSAFARGFSLIELLVAMAITSVIMITLFAMVGQSTANYTQTQRAVNSVSQARAFIQFFARELSTRLPDTPLIHEKGNGTGVTSSDRIAFIRALSTDEFIEDKPGDLGTSIYYVDFSNDDANSESPKLFRKHLDPTETQALLDAGTTPAFPTVDPALDEPIVPNILSFQAHPVYRDPADDELKDWDENSPQRPSFIQLKITFIDESSAQRFKTQADWNRIATSPQDHELQLFRSFTRNIAIAK